MKNQTPMHTHHHHHHHRFNARLSALALVGRFPKTPFLHTVRSCASHLLSPILFMSSFTHSCHVFLPLPFPRATSTTSSTPSRPNNSSLDFLSFKVTPHIHLTIDLTVFTSLRTSSTFAAHV